MQHDKYELTHKMFIRALKELAKIEDRISQIPWRKLDQPYQLGWNLSIVLRADIARSAKGPVIEALLKKYAHKGALPIRNPKIVSAIRKKPSLDTARRFLFIRDSYYGPYVKNLSKREYEKLDLQWKKYFEFNQDAKATEQYSFCLPTFYLEIKVDKRIITHTKDINPVLEKRKAELKKILEPYWMTRRHNNRTYRWFENRKDRRKSKAEIPQLIEGQYLDEEKLKNWKAKVYQEL